MKKVKTSNTQKQHALNCGTKAVQAGRLLKFAEPHQIQGKIKKKSSV